MYYITDTNKRTNGRTDYYDYMTFVRFRKNGTAGEVQNILTPLKANTNISFLLKVPFLVFGLAFNAQFVEFYNKTNFISFGFCSGLVSVEYTCKLCEFMSLENGMTNDMFGT